MLREIALDTETTGLDPASGHRVVEVGCVELMGRIPTGRELHFYFNPDRDMPPEAEEIHGLSSAFLADKPRFHEKADELLEFISDSPLVIHNAGFDIRFLNAELERLGYPPLPLDRSIDTVAMARQVFPGSPASLDALCKRFEIDSAARVKHGALLDAQLLAEVYLELTGGRQSMLVLEERVDIDITLEVERAVKTRFAREFLPSADELLAHAAFIAKLKDPIWRKLGWE